MMTLNLRTRVAKRFALGTEFHGYGNYLRAFADGAVDIDFLQDRYNHAVEHLSQLAVEGCSKDDHIAAVVWFCNFATICEDVGIDWSDIMMVTTPEEAEALRRIIHLKYKGKRAIKAV